MMNDPNGITAPIVEYITPPKYPPNPVDPKRRCDNCAHWLNDHVRRCAQILQNGQPGPMVEIKELIRAGVKLPTSEQRLYISFCTRIPVWAQTTDDHWCKQWDIV